MSPPPPGPASALARFRWPLVVLFLGLMVLLGYLATLWMARRTYEETLDRGQRASQAAVQAITTMAERFSSGQVTHTFQSALPQIFPTGQGHLEVAVAQQVETFRAEDSKRLFWDKLPIGTTVSEIRVPVTYRYHLRLADPWQIEVSGHSCIVTAPPIRPSQPPAVHTEGLERRSEEGWGRFNARAQMEALEKGITPTLEEYAADPRRLALIREQSRQAVAAFVRNWLLREDHWREDRFHSIKVIFADETLSLPEAARPE